ncbi:hypothetical protein KJY77_00255 [Canibacter sp. lx-72]|uniref:hypothetical protein n=1 Tax=Canibacter zhuwentaonis TaxID=2837491 RepID=UPI001BDCF917|nr:hypothetical protein [Canibacter zhuwentaonis]MBT1017578.1 hypothetical protein [Canibacter zhuwentaonis]
MADNQINIRIHTPRHAKPKPSWLKRLAQRLSLGVVPVTISVPASGISRVKVTQTGDDDDLLALAKAAGVMRETPATAMDSEVVEGGEAR